MPMPPRASPGHAGLPPAHAHASRSHAGPASDPDAILQALPLGTRDWVRVLGAILRKHNHQHASKHKGVSLKTMLDRQQFLVAFFRELRGNTRFTNLDPRQLATRHIDAMLDRWLDRKLSTATIHNYLSFLRTFSAWIGKPGMVRRPDYYLGTDSPHAHRHQAARTDKSWSAHDIDIEAKIREIAAFDRWVGLQLELCFRFAMRGKEARHFRPHDAVRQRDAAQPDDAAAFPEADTFIRLVHGTKGGRLRDVPVQTPAQRELLERCLQAVPRGQFIGDASKSATASRRRFYYVLHKFGISKKALGVVAHGLRHQHVNDGYQADTGSASPVRGGTARPANAEQARLRAARLLGHGRTEVTNCYLGPSRAHTSAQIERALPGTEPAPASVLPSTSTAP